MHATLPPDEFIAMKNYGGQTMLSFAIEFNQREITDYFIKCGASVNEAFDVSN